MRPRLTSWMTAVDRDILELLYNGDEQELRLTPRVIAANTDWKRVTIQEHLGILMDHNVIEYHDEEKGLYRLSDRGRAYLAGELDADDLEEE